MCITRVKKLLNRVSIYLLLGVMLFVSMPFTEPVSAATLNIEPTDISVSGDHKSVTVSTDVYATPAGTLDELKAAISVKRTGASDYSALTTGDTVVISNIPDSSTELVVSLESELTGNANALRIASGALEDSGGVPYDQVDIEIDITPPAYVGSYPGDNGGYVVLKFDENFTINSGEEEMDTFLQSKISVSTDGVNYSPLSEQGYFSQNGSELYIDYDNDMQIILGTNTKIKIASGTLKDAAGNLNAEMILDVAPPVIQNVEISSDNHDVTINFQEDVFANTLEGSDSYLKDNIYLLRNGVESDWEGLTGDDTVSIVSGELVIHFAQGLSGANNQIIIAGEALRDIYGNVSSEYIATPYIEVHAGVVDPNPVEDTSAPELVESYISNGNQDITFLFDEDVLNNQADEAAFKTGIVEFYNSNSWGKLPDDTTVSFLGKTITFHFSAPLTGSYYELRIPGGFVKDISENVIDRSINGSMYPVQTIWFDDGYFSNNGRWLNMEFNTNIEDNTLIEGLSHLKEKIMISTDQGTTYSALSEQDVISIQEDQLIVIFHEPKKSGTVKVRIEADALTDEHNNVGNTVIDEVFAYNRPDVKGYFFSDTDSEFVFEDNEVWRSKIKDIVVYDDYNEVPRRMNSSEYTLTPGKLTIKQGIFQKDMYYYIAINSEGYSSQYVEGQALKSSEIFYMTAPVKTTENGITASINVVNTDMNYYYFRDYYHALTGNQTVVFELMNGTTPVSIVAANLKMNTGTYSANFNVTDAATNPNYTVRAFIVNTFNHDLTNVRVNLATQVTQAELDLIQIELNQQQEDKY